MSTVKRYKLLGFSFIVFFTFTSFAESIKWMDRVLPLPKEMSIIDSITVKTDDISYHLLTKKDVPLFKTVKYLLNSFTRGEDTQESKVDISLALLDETPKAVPDALYNRLQKLPNAEQAYAIVCEKGSPLKIILAANTPTGLLYAVRTLHQLVKPGENIDKSTLLEIPLVNIVDWPDIKQRGEWGVSGYSSWGWYSQWKLNMYKVTVSSRFKSANELPTFVLFSNLSDGDEFLPWSKELGYTLIPYIPHLGHLSNKEWAHISPPVYTAEHPRPSTSSYRGFCWSDKGIIEVLTDHMRRMVEVSESGDIEIWLTEGDNITCYCSGCKGENGYLLETKGIIKAYEKVKQEYPKTRLRLALSQGSRAVNDKIIELAKSHNIGITYYDGSLTYRVDREQMIFRELEDFARSGGLVDIVPIVTPCFHALFPANMAHLIQFRAQEFMDKRVTAATCYSQGGQFYYEFNMAAWAEYTWNAYGRSPYDFARAYATITGIAEPELFARWADKSGKVAWELATSGYMRSLGFAQYTWLPSIIKNTEPQRYNTIRVEKVMQDARDAVILAREAGAPLMLVESEFALAALKSIVLRTEIKELLRSVDNKRVVAEKLDELDICAHLMRADIYEWHRIAQEKKQLLQTAKGYIRPPFVFGMYPYRFLGWRGELQAHGLLRASDVERLTASLLGIPDTRGEFGPIEIGEWAEKDFKEGIAKIRVDISSFVPLSGGYYDLGLNMLEGARCNISKISLVVINTATGKENIIVSDDLARYVDIAEAATSFFDHLLIISGRNGEEKLFLEITLTGGKDSSGYITMRRVYPRNEFPQEKIDRLLH